MRIEFNKAEIAKTDFQGRLVVKLILSNPIEKVVGSYGLELVNIKEIKCHPNSLEGQFHLTNDESGYYEGDGVLETIGMGSGCWLVKDKFNK